MKRHRECRRLVVAGALAAATVAVPVAVAQTMGPGFRAIGLKNEDWAAMVAAERTLYEPDVAEVGAEAPWRSDSGAEGVVRLVSDAPGADGRACVVVRHIARPPGRDEVAADTRRCRDASGKWLLAARP